MSKCLYTMLTAALFMIAKTWKQHRVHQQMNVGHVHNGVLFCLKKGGHSDTCYNSNGP